MDESSGNIADQLGSFNGVVQSTPVYSQTGVLGTSIDFDGSDYFTFGTVPETEFSLQTWSTQDTINTRRYLFGADAINGWGIGADVTNVFNIGKIGIDEVDGIVTWTTLNTFTHWIYMYSGSTLQVYKNGVFQENITHVNNWGGTTYGIGSRASRSDGWKGKLDEIGLWNRTLTQGEITNLYNGGLGLNYSLFNASFNNFSITLKSNYDNSSLTNFSVFINSDNYSDNGTGTITTDILDDNTSLFNITVMKENYFNSTYLNYNVSNNLDAFINGTNLTLRIVFNGTNITADLNPTLLQDLSNLVNFTSPTGYFNITPPPLENINFTISCNLSSFSPVNFTLNFSARDTSEYVIFVEPNFNSITFLDGTNSSPIVNATINITYPISGDEIQLTTNSNGTAFFSWIKNDVVEFGNYTFEFDKIGYNLITITQELNSSVVPVALEYNVSRSTLLINVFDRETFQLLNTQNVTLNMLGVFENVTSNGTLTFQDIALISKEYTLQAISDGYGTEQTTFTYNNQDNLTINFYLLNLTGENTGTLFVNIIDEYYFKQLEADVVLMEYSSADNGFITVSECLTNTNGECVFNIELNVKTYIITASKIIDGNLFSANSGTAGEIIKTDQEVRRLILRTSEDFVATSVDNLIYSVIESFENNLSEIVVEFSTVDNTLTTVCIEYFLIDGFIKTSVLLTCTTSNNAVADLEAEIELNRSNQYEAEVYNLVSGAKYGLSKFNYPSLTSTSTVFKKIGMTRYIILGIFIIMLSVSLASGNISLFFFSIMFGSWVLYGIFPQDLLLTFVVGITICCLAGIHLARKKIQEG